MRPQKGPDARNLLIQEILVVGWVDRRGGAGGVLCGGVGSAELGWGELGWTGVGLGKVGSDCFDLWNSNQRYLGTRGKQGTWHSHSSSKMVTISNPWTIV